MPVNANIALGYKSPEFMTPAQGISLANVARQGQLQQVQLEEAQVNQEKQNNLRQVLQTATDPSTGRLTPEGLSAITKLDPKMGLDLTGQQDKLRLQDIAFNEKKNEVMKHVGTSYVTAYDRYMEQTGGNKEQARMMAQKDALAGIDELDKNGTLRLAGLDSKAIDGLRSLQDPEQTRSIVRALGGNVEPPKPSSPLGKLEADRKAGVISAADAAAEKKKMTAPTFQMMMQDINISQEDKAYWADVLRRGGTLPPGLARSAAGAKLVSEVMKEVPKTGKPEEMLANQAEFQGIKAGQRTLGNRTANIEMAVTEAQNMAPLALQASAKVNRTEYPTLNKLILAAEKGTGDENVVRLGVATNSLINIYARAISPTGVPTVSDKDHARELLSAAWAKGQYAAGVDQLMKELDAARKSPGQVRDAFRSAMTGKPEGKAKASGWTDADEKRLQELEAKHGAK